MLFESMVTDLARSTVRQEQIPWPPTRRQPSPCGRADIRRGRSPTANSGRGNHAGSSHGEVVTPPRKSLSLRASDLSALPQGEGWPFVAPASPPLSPCPPSPSPATNP